MLDVVEVEDDILEEENDEEDEKDPSSLFVEVAINCEAEEESCLTAVLPKISKENTLKVFRHIVSAYSYNHNKLLLNIFFNQNGQFTRECSAK